MEQLTVKQRYASVTEGLLYEVGGNNAYQFIRRRSTETQRKSEYDRMADLSS